MPSESSSGTLARPGVVLPLGVVLALGAVLAPAPVRAYTFRSTAEGSPVRWSEPTIELRVDRALDGDRSEDVAQAAADAWAAAPTGPRIVIAGEVARAPGYRGDGRDENGVYVLRHWDYAPALAVTVTSSREHDGVIVDSDVLVSEREDLVVVSLETERLLPLFDLQSVLTHELGHLLGLGESEIDGATMWPSLRPGELEGRSIGADDVDGLAALYAGQARRIASYGCAAGGSTGGLGGALGIVLAMVVTRRRMGARVATVACCVGLVALLSAFGGDAQQRTVEARVVATEVEDRDGLYVTIARVVTDTGAERLVEVPGGTRHGIVQRVGDIEPPRVGETLVLGAAPLPGDR